MTMKKMLKILCLLLPVLLLSGCQLALENGKEREQDRLIGVFLTWEYLDLYDHDAFLEDHMEDILKGKTVYSDGSAYQGKLYATRLENGDYSFGDVAGMNFFIPTWVDEWGNSYTGICADEGISNGDTRIHVADEGSTYTIEGTVFAAPADDERTLYENPVYQTGDGQVYCMAGTGMMFSSGAGEFRTRWEESSTATDEAGNKTQNTLIMEIGLEQKEKYEQVTVVQLDDGHQVLHAETYRPEDMPESVAPSDACAYILVENRQEGSVARELYQPGDESMKVYVCREDLVLVGKTVDIIWPE